MGFHTLNKVKTRVNHNLYLEMPQIQTETITTMMESGEEYYQIDYGDRYRGSENIFSDQ